MDLITFSCHNNYGERNEARRNEIKKGNASPEKEKCDFQKDYSHIHEKNDTKLYQFIRSISCSLDVSTPRITRIS
ncbi:hypothetical protein ACQVU8_30165 [Bacillus cereus]|uniref:hypothetical protein n=1 Tax=Bacillus cereus TaxID=1396 RepID=UPI0012AE64CA|nr:hypothetical protein [Bacillus cereus]